MSYTENPRICAACEQDLFPNYMEGCWEHFAEGCKYTGHCSGMMPEMCGPFKEAQDAK